MQFQTDEQKTIALNSLGKGDTFKSNMIHNPQRKHRPGDSAFIKSSHYLIVCLASLYGDEYEDECKLLAVNISTGDIWKLNEFPDKVISTHLVVKEA